MHSVTIKRNSQGIKIRILRGLTLDLVGWVKAWKVGLRGWWVNGLSAPCLRGDGELLSWTLLCLGWSQLSGELMTFSWGRWVEFDSGLLQMFAVCLQTKNVLTSCVSLTLCWWQVYFPLVLYWKAPHWCGRLVWTLNLGVMNLSLEGLMRLRKHRPL